MNKLIMTALTAGIFLLVSVMNTAAGGGFRGGKGSYGNFYDTSSVSPETLASFNKEIAPLREKLIDKNSELQKEHIKTEPNHDTIATLQKEMIDLRTEIQKIADKYGIENKKKGRGRGRGKGQGRRGGDAKE